MHKKTVIEHLEELIDFYNDYKTTDEQLKKLIVRNLQDVEKRAIKEDAEKNYLAGTR